VAQLAVDDLVVRIDDAQRFTPADRSGRDLEFARVTAAASEFHYDIAACAPLQAHHPGEIVDGDVVTGERPPLWLLGGEGGGPQQQGGDPESLHEGPPPTGER